MQKLLGAHNAGVFLRFTMTDRDGERWTFYNDSNSLKLRK